MRVTGIPVSNLTEADLLALVTSSIAEDYGIEFKRELPLPVNPNPAHSKPQREDEARIEFARDVSAFANSRGGAILYGVDAPEGVARTIVGLPGIVPDSEKLRLEQLLSGHLQPALHGHEIVVVRRSAGAVIVVGIPASRAAPHMVRRTGQFWGRNSAGKYLMDVEEVRHSMLEASAWVTTAEDFRVKRLRRITIEQGIPRLPDYGGPMATCVLHILPLGPRETIDLPARYPEWQRKLLPKIGIAPIIARPNVDGWIASQIAARGVSHVQLFRVGGGLEIRIDLGLRSGAPTADSPHLRIQGVSLDLWLNMWALRAFEWFGLAAVEPPYGVLLSMVGVYGASMLMEMPTEANFLMVSDYPCDVSEVIVPIQVFDSVPTDLTGVLRRTFDVMWHACGWESSPMSVEGTFIYADQMRGVHW